jgi:uncharacterized protein with von Willebrand factor type A (vWA) domain
MRRSQVRACGGEALGVFQHLRVDAELDDVFRLGVARELGIEHLVAEVAEGRWRIDLDQKIRIPAPTAELQNGLVDDVGAGMERLLRHLEPLFDLALARFLTAVTAR